jgi:hypothetical protein
MDKDLDITNKTDKFLFEGGLMHRFLWTSHMKKNTGVICWSMWGKKSGSLLLQCTLFSSSSGSDFDDQRKCLFPEGKNI